MTTTRRFLCLDDDFITDTRAATPEDGPCECGAVEGDLVQPLNVEGGPGPICASCRADLDWQEEVL